MKGSSLPPINQGRPVNKVSSGTKSVRTAIICFIFFVICPFFIYEFYQMGRTEFDDAYMYIRYARHFLNGYGFSWNITEGPAYGCTSALYLFLITLVRGLTSLSDGSVLTITSLLSGLAAAAALAVLAHSMLESPGLRSAWIPLLVVPSVVATKEFVYHCKTGMETNLVLFLIALFCLSVFKYTKRQTRLRFALILITGYLSFLTRPDAGIYWILFPPVFFIFWGGLPLKNTFAYIASCAAILAIDTIIKIRLFGGFIPLPFFAKSNGFYEGYMGMHEWNAFEFLVSFFRISLPFVLAIICLGRRTVLKKIFLILIPLFLTFAYFSSIVQIMGYKSRFYYPSLPFMLTAAMLAINSFTASGGRIRAADARPLAVRMLVSVMALVIFAGSVFWYVTDFAWNKIHDAAGQEFIPKREYILADETSVELPLPEWWEAVGSLTDLLRSLPPEVVFAGSEYGFVGSRMPEKKIIDLVGLHDKKIAKKGFSLDHILGQKPDIIWFPHWDYSRIIAEFLDSPRFAAEFDYIPRIYMCGLAVRKDSQYFNQIAAGLQKQFTVLYGRGDISGYIAQPADAGPKEKARPFPPYNPGS